MAVFLRGDLEIELALGYVTIEFCQQCMELICVDEAIAVEAACSLTQRTLTDSAECRAGSTLHGWEQAMVPQQILCRRRKTRFAFLT